MNKMQKTKHLFKGFWEQPGKPGLEGLNSGWKEKYIEVNLTLTTIFSLIHFPIPSMIHRSHRKSCSRNHAELGGKNLNSEFSRQPGCEETKSRRKENHREVNHCLDIGWMEQEVKKKKKSHPELLRTLKTKQNLTFSQSLEVKIWVQCLPKVRGYVKPPDVQVKLQKDNRLVVRTNQKETCLKISLSLPHHWLDLDDEPWTAFWKKNQFS